MERRGSAGAPPEASAGERSLGHVDEGPPGGALGRPAGPGIEPAPLPRPATRPAGAIAPGQTAPPPDAVAPPAPATPEPRASHGQAADAHRSPSAAPNPSRPADGPAPIANGHRPRVPAAAPPTPGFDEGAEAPPPIRISIGRVEVRTIQPPTSAAPPARPDPRLSLDQYLERSRSRG